MIHVIPQQYIVDDQDGAQRRRSRRATTARADDGKDADIAEITGETATEEILENIFSNFCVGK